MRARVALVAAVAVVLYLVAPSSVAAQEQSVDAATAADLARRAGDDDAALADLRAIDEIDGRRVDLDAATAAMGADRQARLDALALALDRFGGATPSPGAAEPEAARRAARQVLDDDKFRATELPRPFQRPLELLADLLRPVGRLLVRLVRPILDLPGGRYVLAALIGSATAALVAWLIGRLSRSEVERAARVRALVDLDADPDQLDRRADDAEADGDRGAAVRLRYEAGLVRLARADRLVLRPDTTAADAARQVGEPAMDRLTSDFEEIVYGGRPALDGDVARARSGWLDVLGAGARR